MFTSPPPLPDGLLLAQRDYTFCTLVLCVTATVVLVYLGGGGGGSGVLGLGLVGRLLAPAGWTGPAALPGVWIGFVIMQATRLVQNVVRLWATNRSFGIIDAKDAEERDGGGADEDEDEEVGGRREKKRGPGGGGAEYHRL